MIHVLIIATSGYINFVEKLINSCEEFFIPEKDKEYHIFTNFENIDTQLNLDSSINVKWHVVPKQDWPYPTLHRFKYFNSEYFSQNHNPEPEFTFYIDADSYFVSKAPYSDVIKEDKIITAVTHCGFVGEKGPFEENINSIFYTRPQNQKIYFGGGFYGAKYSVFKFISNILAYSIKTDLENNIMPVWHDETAMNWYFNTYSFDKINILSPSYHWPEFIGAKQKELNPHIRVKWQVKKDFIQKSFGITPPFSPVLLLIDKGKHREELRK